MLHDHVIRFRLISTALVGVIVTATVLSIISGSQTAYVHHRYHSTGSYSHAPIPTAAEQRATLADTAWYRQLVVTSAQQFASCLSKLRTDARAGDRASAQRDELCAQSSLDLFRTNIPPGSSLTVLLDALVADQAVPARAGGLHAVERALWRGSLTDAAQVDSPLVAASSGIEFAVFRTILTPSQIAVREIDLLRWVVEEVIGSPQELFSGRDDVDVHAVVHSVVLAAQHVAPLLVQLDRARALALTSAVSAAVRADRNLVGTSSALSVQPASWRALAQALDALEQQFGTVSAVTYGYGTGRTYA